MPEKENGKCNCGAKMFQDLIGLIDHFIDNTYTRGYECGYKKGKNDNDRSQ